MTRPVRAGIANRRAVGAVLLALVSVVVPQARATTIEPMTLVTAADHAAQVIDARVVATSARWLENPRRIETVITFAEVEYLKGGNIGGSASSAFELVVPGGTIGSIQMRIAGAPEFHPGDRWILFLLPTYKTHPVVGLTSGAFRVDESILGSPSIRDASGRAVSAIRRGGGVEVIGETSVSADQRLVATEHASLRRTPQKALRAMSREEFVSALRPILAVSRRYSLEQPAGRPVPAVLMPKALTPSTREQRTRPPRASNNGRTQDGAPPTATTPPRRRNR